MKRSSLAQHPCSIAHALDVVGEWWTPLILRDVAYGIRRFRELQADLGISPNILADRLEALCAHGVLEPRRYQERPPRSEYVLTEKGAELIPALLALMAWGDRWTWGEGGGPVRVVHADCATEVGVEVRCPSCERAVAAQELSATLERAPERVPGQGEPGSVSAGRLARARGGVPLRS